MLRRKIWNLTLTSANGKRTVSEEMMEPQLLVVLTAAHCQDSIATKDIGRSYSWPLTIVSARA
jgi:hypothetical protein